MAAPPFLGCHMRLVKNGQLKIIDDKSGLVSVLKSAGWVEEKAIKLDGPEPQGILDRIMKSIKGA